MTAFWFTLAALGTVLLCALAVVVRIGGRAFHGGFAYGAWDLFGILALSALATAVATLCFVNARRVGEPWPVRAGAALLVIDVLATAALLAMLAAWGTLV